MAKRLKGFSRERHIQLGRDLVAVDELLRKTINDALLVYSVKGVEIRALEKAYSVIETLRMVMDEAAGSEPHVRDEAMYFAYFPTPKSRGQT